MKMPHSRPMNALNGGQRGTLVGGRNALSGLGASSTISRADGSIKGRGYLGPIPDSQGRPMTEFSMGVGFDSGEMDIPTLVPSLSPEEIQFLQNMQPGTPIPQSIQQKAIEHAKLRMRQGLSVFNDSPAHARAKY